MGYQTGAEAEGYRGVDEVVCEGEGCCEGGAGGADKFCCKGVAVQACALAFWLALSASGGAFLPEHWPLLYGSIIFTQGFL